MYETQLKIKHESEKRKQDTSEKDVSSEKKVKMYLHKSQ